MSVAELRQMSLQELKAELNKARADSFKCKMAKFHSESSKPHLQKQARKRVAQIATILTEQAKAGEQQ